MKKIFLFIWLLLIFSSIFVFADSFYVNNPVVSLNYLNKRFEEFKNDILNEINDQFHLINISNNNNIQNIDIENLKKEILENLDSKIIKKLNDLEDLSDLKIEKVKEELKRDFRIEKDQNKINKDLENKENNENNEDLLDFEKKDKNNNLQYEIYNIRKNSKIIFDKNTEFILRSGNATITDATFNGIVNLTEGKGQYNEEEIIANNLYLVPRKDSRGILTNSDIWILIKGNFDLYGDFVK